MKRILFIAVVAIFCMGVFTACFFDSEYNEPVSNGPLMSDDLEAVVNGTTVQFRIGFDENLDNFKYKAKGIYISDVRSMVDPRAFTDLMYSGENNNGINYYTISIKNFSPGREYFYQSFINSGGSILTSNVYNFTTATATTPILHLDIDLHNGTLKAELDDYGSANIVMSGFCWLKKTHYSNHPTISDNIKYVDIDKMRNYQISDLIDLSPNSSYSVCAFAINGYLGYSETVGFKTDENGNIY